MKRLVAILSSIVLLSTIFTIPTLIFATTDCTFTIDGTTMKLDADCTTDETILVQDGFTLDGQGYTITATDPFSGHFVGAVVKNGGATAHVEHLVITTSSLVNVCDGGADRLRGIMFEDASGSITDNTVANINQGTSGCQEGNAIEVRHAPFDGTHPDTKTVVISGNVVTNYQKSGIVANGDVSVTITNNMITGAGKVDYIAQNGIQLGFGATGEVRSNTITGNFYTGCSNQDAAKTGCTPFVSAGLLLFDVKSNSITHSNNKFNDNQFNLLLVNSQSM